MLSLENLAQHAYDLKVELALVNKLLKLRYGKVKAKVKKAKRKHKGKNGGWTAKSRKKLSRALIEYHRRRKAEDKAKE